MRIERTSSCVGMKECRDGERRILTNVEGGMGVRTIAKETRQKVTSCICLDNFTYTKSAQPASLQGAIERQKTTCCIRKNVTSGRPIIPKVKVPEI